MGHESYVSTSVDDARISLEGILNHDPMKCLKICTATLDEIRFIKGQVSRRKLMASLIRKCVKVLEVEF